VAQSLYAEAEDIPIRRGGLFKKIIKSWVNMKLYTSLKTTGAIIEW
jgi:hypothetical protein